MNYWSRIYGLSLIELVITMALTALLVLGLVGIASAASSSTRLQRNQAQIQEHARLAVSRLSRSIRHAGFTPEPWNEDDPSFGLTEETADNVSASSDRLAVKSWSDLNCYNNRNPDTDDFGIPHFYIRESVFDLNGANGLTHLCRYGPSPGALTTQIRRQGFIQGVEQFQLLFGQDSDQDGAIDAWVNAGDWSDPAHVLGIRVGLLLASLEPVADKEARTHAVLDESVFKSADGKMRRVAQFTIAIRGRTN